MNQILVFKTNILSANAEVRVALLLNAQSNVLQWSIDHEDIDEVLRVVVLGMEEADLMSLLNGLGLQCTPLRDELVPESRFQF
ncbi:hypothetical protein [Chitinophaga costaii]|nr:hypothetical protein [Chitinophaga costaii]